LERFQARAYVIVPIFLGNKLWGLLATYQNSGSRQWKAAETKLVVEIGNQLGVALQQAELLAQIQKQSEALRQSSQREREKAQELELTLDELRRTQAQKKCASKYSTLFYDKTCRKWYGTGLGLSISHQIVVENTRVESVVFLPQRKERNSLWKFQ
jgi:hypothetical protein